MFWAPPAHLQGAHNFIQQLLNVIFALWQNCWKFLNMQYLCSIKGCELKIIKF